MSRDILANPDQVARHLIDELDKFASDIYERGHRGKAASIREICVRHNSWLDELHKQTPTPTICANCKWIKAEHSIGGIAFPATCKKVMPDGVGFMSFVEGWVSRSICCEDINHGNCPHYEERDDEISL